MKHCNTCHSTKPKSEFGNRKASIDGLSPKCKPCQRVYDKARANKPSRVSARAEYAKTEAGINSQNRARKKYVENNKEKISEINKSYRAENPDKVSESKKKYYQNNKDKILAAGVEYKNKNPKKRNAHTIVSNSIRDGHLFRESCSICNEIDAQAHHDDYDKPLNIRWLCRKHHADWHAKHGEGKNSH
jgi:hypothetical protein